MVVLLGGFICWKVSQAKNQQGSEDSYYKCVKKILKDVQKYGPAADEPVGAKRTDFAGNTWTKNEGGNWETSASGYEYTQWGDAKIDEQPGGINYMPKTFPECEGLRD